MTEPAPDLDPDPQARLARLAAALRQPGPDADLDALAAQHGVTPAAARACQDAVSALARAAALADIADSQPVLPEAYEILDELGRGGMGIVYRARHKALDRVVAVKVLRTGEQMFQDLLARFEVEARSLARLRHPHIVAVHDVGRTGGHVYYTMDLIAGTSLERLLAQGALSPTRTVRLMTQVVAAVEHSHEHGVIHRDLKPANILLDGKEDAFVADFGLARDANLPVELTTTGQIMGTPAYMSPESIRGDTQRIGECSDVWALGVVLYQCLTGVSPFAHRALADTMQAVLHADPQPPRRHNPRIPRDLEIVCLKALAKDPDERYATARALREDLERFRDGHPVLAQRPSLGRRVSRWLLRNRAGILSAALAAGFVGGVAVLWPHPVASPAVIDGVIQDAHHRLRDGDHAAALRLYDIARGLLGSDAQRGLRHGGGVTSGSLVDSVWSGMLTCRGELARRRGENGEPGPAADELAPWLEQCPPEVLDIGSAAAELVVLRVLAGQPDAAAAALRRHLVTARDGAAPQLRTREIGMVLDRLAPVFAATEHPRWRDAGAWLATLCQWEVEGVLGGALDPVLMPRDVAAALVAAWAASGPLPETGRTRLANLVRAHVLQQVGSLQWGTPQASTRTALARVAGDTTLAPTVRHLALDTLCAAVDAPWRPGGSVAETEAQLARVVAWAGRDRAPGYVERVRWALELRAAPERRSPVDPATCLVDHTGAPADTDWRAWWQRNAARLPQEWLADALAGAGVDVRREAEPAQAFSQLRGASRAWLHHWLTLGVAADARAPLWPAGEAEPANLASSWRSGVRVADARYRLVFGWTRLGSDGQLPHGGASHARTIELDRPVQTWVGSDVVSSIDFAGPWAALWARAPE